MKTKILYTFALMLLIKMSAFPQMPSPTNDSGWELVFSDEFTGTALDTSKWDRVWQWNQVGYSKAYGDSIVNAYRVKDLADTINLKVNSGLSLITTERNYSGQVWSWPICSTTTCYSACTNNHCWNIDTLNFKYTTGMLVSKKRFKYGYYEIKFKVPTLPTSPATNYGHGPNFWLWHGSDDTTKTNYSEIDVFEIDAYTNHYTCNNHYRKKKNSYYNSKTFHYGTISGNTWHYAAVDWRADSIDYYFDGVKISGKTMPSVKADSLEPMKMIVDINAPEWNFGRYPFDTVNSVFPYKFEVAYVKVYQMKQACDTTKTYCSITPAGYYSKLFNSISFDGSSCNSVFSGTNNTGIRANNYIELKDGFTIDNTSTVIIETTPCMTNQVNNQRLAPDYYIDGTPPPESFYLKYPIE